MMRVAALQIILLSVCAIAKEAPRIDCHPEPGADKAKCEARGCTWTETAEVGAPYCHSTTTTGYNLDAGFTAAAATLTVSPNAKNPYYANLQKLKFESKKIGKTLNVRIFAENRYEPPLNLPKTPSTSSAVDELELTLNPTGAPGDTFSFIVQRKGVKIWDTSIGGLLFGDQFIQIATHLPTENIYGFGEHIHRRIKHNTKRYTTWPMFTRDIGPDSQSELSTTNLYGVHPFYMGIEEQGDAHGVLILNSNAQEVTIGTGPHLVYRTIGGILDLYFFPGPTPEEVIKQYQALIGKPILPAYSGLGFQLCRWGYENLDDMKGAVKRTQDAGVPLEIVIADIEYMDRYKDFSLGWPGLNDYVKELHNQGLKVTLMTDPAIQVNYPPFQRAMDAKARFIEWPTMADVDATIQNDKDYPLLHGTKIMPGNVWPDNNTAMPDFLDPTGKTTEWWKSEFVKFKTEVVDQDYIWIDMNEPSNFDTDPKPAANVKVDAKYRLKCPTGANAKYDDPKYLTNAVYLQGANNYLFTKTLCMMGQTAGGAHILYNTHSIYGWSMAVASAEAQKALGSRGALISRSTFPSAGHYTGHWLGDNTASWPDLQTSVIGAQEFNMFGFAYVGSDICGFNADTTEELCLRWHQMGAFHPYSRNHNAKGHIRQDPAQWPSVAAAAKMALYFKYHHLPYLYTLMYEAATSGGTVIRPIFFEFPQDKETLDIGHQFMWGSGMMILPAVYEYQHYVTGYIPPQVTWYHLREDKNYGSKLSKDKFQLFSAELNEMIPVIARGGVIIPRQMGASVLRDARKNPFELLIPLEFNAEGAPTAAQGRLFWDDGESVLDVNTKYYLYDFKFETTATTSTLTITQTRATDIALPKVNVIELLGYPYAPDDDTFKLNGVAVVPTKKNDHPGVFVITIAAGIDLQKAANTLTWSTKTLEHETTAAPTLPSTAQETTVASTTTPKPPEGTTSAAARPESVVVTIIFELLRFFNVL